MDCFCGCGKRIPFSLRATNVRAKSINEALLRVQHLLDIGLISPNATTFIEQGTAWRARYVDGLHKGIEPDDYHWWSSALPFHMDFNRMVRDAGLSLDEAMARISAGKWDPYADARYALPPMPGPLDA